jgi:hypothetical protein
MRRRASLLCCVRYINEICVAVCVDKIESSECASMRKDLRCNILCTEIDEKKIELCDVYAHITNIKMYQEATLFFLFVTHALVMMTHFLSCHE